MPSLNPDKPNDDVGCTFPFTIFLDEIILEILIRLTPKSICRLKCLSNTGFLSFPALVYSPPTPLSVLNPHHGSSWTGWAAFPQAQAQTYPSPPPNLRTGPPSRITKTGPPTLITSSNGLILFSLTPSDLLYIGNPVTRDWAPLPVPDCGKITTLPRVGLSAKYTPTCDVIEYQTTRKGRYRSQGKWQHSLQKQELKEAIVYYSRSISCLPTAAAYANRAAASFELGKYQEAEMDCSEALKIDQHYVKVYVRRAIVRKELGMFFKAKEDVEMTLKLDGEHHEVLKLYAEINCLLDKC